MEQPMFVFILTILTVAFVLLAGIYHGITTRRERHIYTVKMETRNGTTWISIKCICHLNGHTEALHTRYVIRRDNLSAWIYDEEAGTIKELRAKRRRV